MSNACAIALGFSPTDVSRYLMLAYAFQQQIQPKKLGLIQE